MSLMKYREFVESIHEMTVSPDYQSRGTFNPFYTMETTIELSVIKRTNVTSPKYKSVQTGKGTDIGPFGRGSYIFQVYDGDKETNFYFKTAKKNITGHLGMKSRKNATASSDVNEFLSVYFLKHTKYTNPKEFQKEITSKTGDTGVFYGTNKPVTYETLVELIDKDETADRDIEIGYQNALVIKKELKQNIKTLYWTPKIKPGGISKRNVSDVIIELSDGTFVGYSNKIASGKDVTPKFNTNIVAFYKKLNDVKQVKNIESIIDTSWDKAENKVPKSAINSQQALSKFDIRKEKYSESISKTKFATIAKAFILDNLKFYSDDFYYPFRNNLISSFAEYLHNADNLVYFLNTIAYYTYDDVTSTPCPYKLLIGSESGSKIKEVTSNENQKQMLLSTHSKDFTLIKTTYDNSSQSFSLSFKYTPMNYTVTIPITVRTRQAGGWSGKSLYINTPGIKIK